MFAHVTRHWKVISFNKLILNPIWVFDCSSVLLSACVISRFQLDLKTVFLSISSFSMKPDGRWFSSRRYISIMGFISISIEHSFSRISRKTFIMKPKESISSTFRDSLPIWNGDFQSTNTRQKANVTRWNRMNQNENWMPVYLTLMVQLCSAKEPQWHEPIQTFQSPSQPFRSRPASPHRFQEKDLSWKILRMQCLCQDPRANCTVNEQGGKDSAERWCSME